MKASSKISRQQRMAAARTKRLRRAWADAIFVIHMMALSAAPWLFGGDSPVLMAVVLTAPFSAALFFLLRHAPSP